MSRITDIFSFSDLKENIIESKNKFRRFIKSYMLCTKPQHHVLSSVVTLFLALSFGLIITGSLWTYSYFPPHISDTAIQPTARAFLQTFQLFTVYSIFVLIRSTFYLMRHYNWKNSLNWTMYIFGISGNVLFPVVFIFDTKNFPLIHNILTIFTMICFSVYFWLFAFSVKHLHKYCNYLLVNGRKHFILRIILNSLMSAIVLHQIGCIIYRRITPLNSLVTNQSIQQFNVLLILSSSTQWLMMLILMIQTLLIYHEQKNLFKHCRFNVLTFDNQSTRSNIRECSCSEMNVKNDICEDDIGLRKE